MKIGVFKRKLKRWVEANIDRFTNWGLPLHHLNLHYNTVMQRLLKEVVYYLYVLCLINQSINSGFNQEPIGKTWKVGKEVLLEIYQKTKEE